MKVLLVLILASSAFNPRFIAEPFLPTTPSALLHPHHFYHFVHYLIVHYFLTRRVTVLVLYYCKWVCTVSPQDLIPTIQYTSLSLTRFALFNLNTESLHNAGNSADIKASASSYRSIPSLRILCDSFQLSGQYPVSCSGSSRKVRIPSATSVNTTHLAKKFTDK